MPDQVKKYFKEQTGCDPNAGNYRFNVKTILQLMEGYAKHQQKPVCNNEHRCEQHIPSHCLGTNHN